MTGRFLCDVPRRCILLDEAVRVRGAPMPGVKILRLYGDDMLASPVWRKRWKTARMERSSADHGVYAYSTMAVAMEEYWDAETILAEVVADGKVHAHARGWHADAATITRIYLPMRHWHMRPALLARYGVPIEPLSRLAAPRSTIRGLRPWLATLGVDDVLPLTLPGGGIAARIDFRRCMTQSRRGPARNAPGTEHA
jgi:hypothetical protein